MTAELHKFGDVNDGDITAACGRNVNSRESVVVIDLEAASNDEPLPSRVSIQKKWPLSSHYPRLLPKENLREPFGLSKIKVGSPSQNFRSPELISD